MFNTVSASPADAVTTRRLQIARRSAQRKTKPTQGSRIKSRRSEKLSNQGQGDERNRANFMPTAFNQTVLSTVIAMQPATHIYRFMFDQGWTLVPLNRLWSFGFDGHQLMTLLQRLPTPSLTCAPVGRPSSEQVHRRTSKLVSDVGRSQMKNSQSLCTRICSFAGRQ